MLLRKILEAVEAEYAGVSDGRAIPNRISPSTNAKMLSEGPNFAIRCEPTKRRCRSRTALLDCPTAALKLQENTPMMADHNLWSENGLRDTNQRLSNNWGRGGGEVWTGRKG